MSYPVTLEVDYIDRRSRLTTFFRFLLAIPHYIVLLLYGIGALFVVIVAWFALLFTGRWPVALYEFMVGFLRFYARFNCYLYLTVDRFPPFNGNPDPAYPARLLVAPQLAGYSRLKVFLRVFYALIPAIIAGVMSYAIALVGFVSWLVIVITGRQPAGLQNAMVFLLAYTVRAYALMLLVTETWPPFEP